MTTQDEPILRMSRIIGSWLVRLDALSVAQFAEQCGGPGAFTTSAIERLIAHGTVRETEEEACFTYTTRFPAAVKQQWLALGERCLEHRDGRCACRATERCGEWALSDACSSTIRI
jgi:hypothetical protein